ncbi:hypothetical protein GGX14DRAFT_448945 [Mycena pura]|uniref:Uncharacterized protein n=1 Tax=Mycena pura TaxID=153505 RepID=A0AAD6VFM1_9AGAR|nr:hypothetical protein GGX14DRAFT_448945 [Mycena pura]
MTSRHHASISPVVSQHRKLTAPQAQAQSITSALHPFYASEQCTRIHRDTSFINNQQRLPHSVGFFLPLLTPSPRAPAYLDVSSWNLSCRAPPFSLLREGLCMYIPPLCYNHHVLPPRPSYRRHQWLLRFSRSPGFPPHHIPLCAARLPRGQYCVPRRDEECCAGASCASQSSAPPCRIGVRPQTRFEKAFIPLWLTAHRLR